jgi:hypothetical protein
MLKPLERLGLVAKIATLRLLLHNTTNCQKMWNEYGHYLGPDDSLVSNVTVSMYHLDLDRTSAAWMLCLKWSP